MSEFLTFGDHTNVNANTAFIYTVQAIFGQSDNSDILRKSFVIKQATLSVPLDQNLQSFRIRILPLSLNCFVTRSL